MRVHNLACRLEEIAVLKDFDMDVYTFSDRIRGFDVTAVPTEFADANLDHGLLVRFDDLGCGYKWVPGDAPAVVCPCPCVELLSKARLIQRVPPLHPGPDSSLDRGRVVLIGKDNDQRTPVTERHPPRFQEMRRLRRTT